MIQPIVEGHGEVEALPVLLRRLLAEGELLDVEIGRPIRGKRTRMTTKEGIERLVKVAMLKKPRAMLVLLDADDDCAMSLASQIHAWVAAILPTDIVVSVVVATREYEAWFLAGVRGIRGERGIRLDAEPHSDPELPRDAKGRLEALMEPNRSYSEKADQAALSARFSMDDAFSLCRSFRHLVTEIPKLVAASGHTLPSWPPDPWLGT